MARKSKQQFIEGTEPESIPEIEQAAEAYREARDSRMNKLEVEIELKKDLTELMKKHKLSEYKYDDQVVVLEGGEPKVKVQKVKKETVEA